MVTSICGKTMAQLSAVVDQFQQKSGVALELPAEPTFDDLAKITYQKAQEEVISKGVASDVKEWPGCAGVPPLEKSGSAKTAPSKQAMHEKMADMLLSKNDKDKDGKLSHEELADVVEQTNRAAKAKGEKEVDFLKSVDTNEDGFAERAELVAFFAKMNLGGGGAGGGAGARASGASSVPDAQELHRKMFENLDKDGDGKLSKQEMQTVIEKTNQQVANQAEGESGEDIFASLDSDGDGSIDKEEASAFFRGAMDGLRTTKPAKDEV